jgi:hypothetical protein
MNAVLLAMVVAVWLLSGVLAYGGLFAYLQKQYPSLTAADSRDNRRYPLFPALFGPIGLIVVALATRCFKDGLKFS